MTHSKASDTVFESQASLVIDQAENRRHAIKVVETATFGNRRPKDVP
jgi:ornithine carbamoyltransferase